MPNLHDMMNTMRERHELHRQLDNLTGHHLLRD
jgi:hypothetical protein